MMIIDKSIKEKLNILYDLDWECYVHNLNNIKTLDFSHPRVDFLKDIFLEFFHDVESTEYYITKGFNIGDDTQYLNLKRKDFFKFLDNKTFSLKNDGFDENISWYYLTGILVFDTTFLWIIHKNPDTAEITFSYQYKKFNKFESLLKNEWLVLSDNME